jgi:hypothetical protein
VLSGSTVHSSCPTTGARVMDHAAGLGRRAVAGGGWCAAAPGVDDYLQVTFPTPRTVTGVGIQARGFDTVDYPSDYDLPDRNAGESTARVLLFAS